MEQTIYNLAILGGGPAGYVAAIRGAQLGAKVVLVEQTALGGTCMNVGCIPTKALLRSAEGALTIRKGKEFGVTAQSDGLSWSTAITRKNRMVKHLGLGVAHLLSSHGVTVVDGTGQVISPTEMTVTTKDGVVDLRFEKLILATGSRPLIPSFIEGVDLEGVITSTDLLSMEDVPATMAIIGGGVIGMELATLLSAAGCKVTIVELCDRILPTADPEVSAALTKQMKRQGISFLLGASVTAITQGQDWLVLHYTKDGEAQTLSCHKVLLSLGRSYNTQPFEALKLPLDRGHLVVNESMETAIPNVYGAGDLVGGKLLAHVAFFEGRTAAERAMGQPVTFQDSAIPACVYTTPELASVGLQEEEAKSMGIQCRSATFDLRHNGRAFTLGERDGFVKVIVDEEGVILGGQILGPSASEMISELTLAVSLKLTAQQLSNVIHPHPSISEAIWEVCCALSGRAIHGG